MSNKIYKFKKNKDNRWGIYFQDRLLATVGNYEICQSIGQYLNGKLSDSDTFKAAIAYKTAINKSLVINQ